MTAVQDRYDSFLLGILQNEGQIGNFLDVIFSFLYRRTDFFLLMEHEKDTKGFPPGVASKIAYSAFKKYEELAKKREERLAKAKVPVLPPVAHTVEVSSTNNTASPDHLASESISGERAKPSAKTTHNIPVQTTKTKKTVTKTEPKSLPEPPAQQDTVSKSEDKSAASEGQASAETGNKGGDEDDNPEQTRLQKEYQSHPESYNGAIRENYCWSQQIADVDVRIKVPKYVTKGKQVQVVLERKHLKARYLDDKAEWQTIVDGELTWDINKEESMWTLVPGEHIHVNVEKVQERWWEAVYTTEPHISVRKIDPSRPMTDLDQEAQAKIDEMMFNERQKKLGLPQSHEMKVHETLRNAWDLEGSPFKGQPFDPSKLNISTGESS